MVDAAIEAFAGTGKPYLHISGAWIYGDNTLISEESPINAPALVAWREPIETRIVDATASAAVIVSRRSRYGDGGGGLPGLLLGSPRDDAGNLIMIGTGQQHWSTVHVADLAEFFRRVLESPDVGDVATTSWVTDSNPTVAELHSSGRRRCRRRRMVAGSDNEARAACGRLLR